MAASLLVGAKEEPLVDEGYLLRNAMIFECVCGKSFFFVQLGQSMCVVVDGKKVQQIELEFMFKWKGDWLELWEIAYQECDCCKLDCPSLYGLFCN